MENYRLEQTGQEVQDILNGAAMQTDLTAEVERAEGAEQTLQGNIDDEERRAKAAEETLSGAIGDEELRAKAAEEALGGAIDGINAKIPAAASSENKLADQEFVNSSIETATATFRGTYNLVSDLHLAVDATHEQIATLLGTVIAEADNNDYSYVLVPTSAQTPTEIASIEKYTFGANGWAFAYALNNSGFTSAQWAAINSGITSGLVAKLNALPTNTDLLALLAGKQDVLTFDDVPVEGSNNPVKSGGVHSAIDDEKTARVNAVNGVAGRVDTIEGEIPAQASSENQLADKAYVNSSISTNTATYRGSFNLVADLGLSVSATHEQIGTALAGEISTADNNDYAYVQVPTSDETPSQILKVERYKFNGTAWAFEYELNNSGFTSAEWAALNSGITSGLVGKLNALPTNDELTLALAGKQDVLTFDNTPTENSNNPVKSGGVYAADKSLSDAIEAILLLIPSAATSLNKLVDTDLMNSSISTATATFRGTFNLVSDLSLDLTATHAQIATALAGAIATADNNDYCFVQIPTAVGTPTEIASTDRYKFNGTAWAFEYTLNNSGFTSAQWAAINSAITTELVAKLTDLPTNAELLESLGLLSSGISGINAKIPSAASSENKLVDGTAMETYVAQIVNAIDATFNVTSTDGHVTLAITQVNGVITSVQLTTSDIASAAALTLLAGRVTTAEGNITSLTGRMTTAEGDIDQLLALYNALQQSAPQVIQPTDTWPVTNPSTTVIYRVIDRVNTPPEYYSDYMWNGTSMVLMATYNNAIDTTPKKDSANLITSGGVFANIGAFDISEYHKSGSTLATYADLTAALAALPSDFQKGGMSIKFVQTSDNNYVQYRLMSDTFNTTVANWQGVDDQPTAGSNNLVKSGGVFAQISDMSYKYQYLSLGYLNENGILIQNNDCKTTDFIPVSEGDVLYVTGQLGPNACIVAGYSDTDESSFVNGLVSYGRYDGHKFTIPSGISYIRASSAFGVSGWLDGKLTGNSQQKIDDLVFDTNYYITYAAGGYCKIGNGKIEFKNVSLFAISSGEYVFLTDGVHSYNQDNSVSYTDGILYINRADFVHNQSVVLRYIGKSALKIIDDKIVLGYAFDAQPMIGSRLNIISIHNEIEKQIFGYKDSSLFTELGYLNTSGILETNSDCRTTDFLPVLEGEVYCYQGFLNIGGACVVGYSNNDESSFVQIIVPYGKYNTNKSFTIPSGVSYIRASSGFITYHGIDWKGSLYSSVGESINKRIEEENEKNLFPDLRGKKVVFFGDSLTEAGIYEAEFEDLTGCIAYNRGVGGTTFAQISSSLLWNDSLCDRVDKSPNESVSAKSSGFPSNPDLIYIMAGSNDWGRVAKEGVTSPVVGGSYQPADYITGERFGDVNVEDKATYCGAIRYILRTLRTKYPQTPIVAILTIHAYSPDSPDQYPIWGEMMLADESNEGSNWTLYKTADDGKTFYDYRNAFREIASIFGIPVIDTFEMGITPYLATDAATYFGSDRLHPNSLGYHLLGRFIYNQLPKQFLKKSL